MSVDSPDWDAVTVDQSWQQIEELVDQIEELSRSGIPPTGFHAGLLDRVVQASAAAGGVIWLLGSEAGLGLEYQINLAAAQLDEVADHRHRLLLQDALGGGAARVVPPQSGSTGSTDAANPTPFLLLLCPLQRGDDVIGVLEVFQRPDISPTARDGYLQLLTSVCQLASDYYAQRQLRELRDREATWSRFADFSTRLHRSLDLPTTAYAIANDGRQFIGCDRVSVVSSGGGRCRVLAVSGVSTVDRRTTSVRLLERLVRAVMAAGQPLYYLGDREEGLAPQIETPLHAYLDEANARSMIVVPLRAGGESGESGEAGRQNFVGALAVEQFDAVAGEAVRQRLDASREHIELAYCNALAVHRLPLSRYLQRAGWLFSAGQLPWTLSLSVFVAALVLAMVFVQADFTVEVYGELQPQLRRDIFAPRDGTVSRLLVDDATAVQSGELLVVLRNLQLDLDFKRVWGEIQTASKKLTAVQAARVVSELAGPDGAIRYNQLTADEAELQALLASLNDQHEVLKQQQKQLEVSSPITGHVLAWNLQQLLENRPVKLGQILMRVADIDGPWVMELSVPDHRVGHVLDARRELGDDLRVSFILAADPNLTHERTIGQVAMSTELNDANEPVVLIKVDIEREAFAELRPGETVIAKIHCGRRSIGYVWLHDLIEAIQTRVFF